MGFLRLRIFLRVFYGQKPGFWHPDIPSAQKRSADSARLLPAGRGMVRIDQID